MPTGKNGKFMKLRKDGSVSFYMAMNVAMSENPRRFNTVFAGRSSGRVSRGGATWTLRDVLRGSPSLSIRVSP